MEHPKRDRVDDSTAATAVINNRTPRHKKKRTTAGHPNDLREETRAAKSVVKEANVDEHVPGLVPCPEENPVGGLPVDTSGGTADQRSTTRTDAARADEGRSHRVKNVRNALNGDTIMGVGKYHHLTYREVTELHRDYAEWAMKTPKPAGPLYNYVEWLYSSEGRLIRQGNRIFPYGQHQGKRFHEIATSDPRYHIRYKHKQPQPNPTLDEYIRYFHDFMANARLPPGHFIDNDMGRETFHFGEHRGQTWHQVALTDPTYHVRFQEKISPVRHAVIDRYARWFREDMEAESTTNIKANEPKNDN